MSLPRDIYITIGKQGYNIRTPIDDKDLERIKALIEEAYGFPLKGVGQEELLVLTCLQLAYSLDRVKRGVQETLDRLDQA